MEFTENLSKVKTKFTLFNIKHVVDIISEHSDYTAFTQVQQSIHPFVFKPE